MFCLFPLGVGCIFRFPFPARFSHFGGTDWQLRFFFSGAPQHMYQHVLECRLPLSVPLAPVRSPVLYFLLLQVTIVTDVGAFLSHPPLAAISFLRPVPLPPFPLLNRVSVPHFFSASFPLMPPCIFVENCLLTFCVCGFCAISFAFTFLLLVRL